MITNFKVFFAYLLLIMDNGLLGIGFWLLVMVYRLLIMDYGLLIMEYGLGIIEKR